MNETMQRCDAPELGLLTFLKAGPLSLVQDHGRINCQSPGLTSSGAADRHAFDWANKLLNNPENTPAFEITLGPVTLHFSKPTRIAITGTQIEAQVVVPAPSQDRTQHDCKEAQTKGVASSANSSQCQRVYPWSTARIPAGGQLHLKYPSEGLRTYIAVEGGFLAPTLFGSCARVPREGLPGPFGTAITQGEQFQYAFLAQKAWQKRNLMTPFYAQPQHQEVLTLPVKSCYQFAQFSQTARNTLFSGTYTVTQLSDRMGYRLSGPKVSYPGELAWSEGIALGSIQIPPNGQPIVLLRDRQTIGGYPKIGTIPASACDSLSQCRPKQKIKFKRI
jgi:allophanate hydrolase subunit 2